MHQSDNRGEACTLFGEYEPEPALAAKLNDTTKTLQRYRSLPDGLPFLRFGGRVYYRLSTVQAWLAKREEHPNARRVRNA